MRIYQMVRDIDETGNSGTGIVGEAVRFSDGRCVLAWSKDSNALAVSSLVFYSTLDDLLKVHGHGGKTRLESVESVRCQGCGYTWHRNEIADGAADKTRDTFCIQCVCEGIPGCVDNGPLLDGKPGVPVGQRKKQTNGV